MSKHQTPGYLQSFYRWPDHRTLGCLCAVLGVYAVFVVLVDQWYLHDLLLIRSTIHTLLGLVLGGCSSFAPTRHTIAVGGTQLWGQLVNDIRNLAIKVQACVQAPVQEKRRFAEHLIAFPRALRDHLRGPVRLSDYPGFADAVANPPHVPLAIAHSLYHELESWKRERELGASSCCFLTSMPRHL